MGEYLCDMSINEIKIIPYLLSYSDAAARVEQLYNIMTSVECVKAEETDFETEMNPKE